MQAVVCGGTTVTLSSHGKRWQHRALPTHTTPHSLTDFLVVVVPFLITKHYLKKNPGILDERGELADGPDTLENALVAEQAARSKARGAATKKAKPLWEEDGKVCVCVWMLCVGGARGSILYAQLLLLVAQLLCCPWWCAVRWCCVQ